VAVTVLRRVAHNCSAKRRIADSCIAYCHIANTYCPQYNMADTRSALYHIANRYCLSDPFPVKNGLKEGDVLSSLFFNCALDYAIRRVQVNQDGVKVNDTRQLWFMLMLICWEEAHMLQ